MASATYFLTKHVFNSRFIHTGNYFLARFNPRKGRVLSAQSRNDNVESNAKNDSDFFGFDDVDVTHVEDASPCKEKFGSLFTKRDSRMSDEVFIQAGFGTLRYDLDNVPKYHGQYEDDRFTVDVVENEGGFNTKADGKFDTTGTEGLDETLNYEDPNIYQGNTKLGSNTNSKGSPLAIRNDSDNYLLQKAVLRSEPEQNSEECLDKSSHGSVQSEQKKHSQFSLRISKNSRPSESFDSTNMPKKELFKIQNSRTSREKSEFEELFERVDSRHVQSKALNQNEKKTAGQSSPLKQDLLLECCEENDDILDEENLGDSMEQIEKQGSTESDSGNKTYQSLSQASANSVRHSLEPWSGASLEKSQKINFKFATTTTNKQDDQVMNETNEQLINDLLRVENTKMQQLEAKREAGRLAMADISSEKPASEKVAENLVPSEEPKTAFDYVKSLRKEKLTATVGTDGSTAKKAPEAGHEMLDSKGFRILSNQVINLDFMTRDEILRMLKKSVIYNENDIVAINKPYGMVCHGPTTGHSGIYLSTYLEELGRFVDRQNPNPKLHMVHRLDKQTTGVMLFAKTPRMANVLQTLLENRKMLKIYWALTKGVPTPLEGNINIPIAEQSVSGRNRMGLRPDVDETGGFQMGSGSSKAYEAITYYKVISSTDSAALVHLKSITGHKHQLRVHLGLGLRCPILGDHKYSHVDRLAPQKLPGDMLEKLRVRQSKVRYIPMHLHARSVIIPEVFDGKNVFIECPLPEHFTKNLRSLKIRKD